MSSKAEVTEARFNAWYLRAGVTDVDIGVADVTNTALHTLSSTPQTVPGGLVAGGERWCPAAAGAYSTGGTAPTGADFFLYWGNISTGTSFLDLAVAAADLPSGASSLSWALDCDVVWQSPTVVTARAALSWRAAGGSNNSKRYYTRTRTTGMDTTAGRFLTVAFQWTGGTGLVLTTDWCHIPRVA